ncbi:MAG: class I mannose-6-phosphate isomerase [Ruminococcaceae bacterium]|nr:class I mannose-6-phosphate isomerase [Oscillospiraceae bacterium]
MNYPIKLKPVFKEIVWGGNRLKNDYGFESNLNNIAEAWMLCARDDGDNIVENGVFSGKSFKEVVAENKSLLGRKGEKYAEFPLLIKFIDAKSDLSVQVHPDDEYARIHENSYGKTEAWYILDCDEGAQLIYGFKNELSRDEFRKSIEDNTFLENVNKVNVKKGDIFFIKAGTLHAIGGGILLAEVQQNCNTTYRVYDYGRLVNGVPRELHIEKAIDVTDTVPPTDSNEPVCVKSGDGFEFKNLCSCEFFNMDTITVEGNYKISGTDDTFISLLVLNGNGSVSFNGTTVDAKSGDSIFIPAGKGDILISGKMEILSSTL